MRLEDVFGSHPSRVRELKLGYRIAHVEGVMSHPSRVRELKHEQGKAQAYLPSRTPPGCVN